VREVLRRPLYRGELIYGKTTKAYGRELKGAQRESTRESAQVSRPEDTWVRREVADLRIVDVELAARVDARRADWHRRVVEAKAKGRATQNASGKYLLSGGLLVCSRVQNIIQSLNEAPSPHFLCPWDGPSVVSLAFPPPRLQPRNAIRAQRGLIRKSASFLGDPCRFLGTGGLRLRR
jgi:hypothetical protein